MCVYVKLGVGWSLQKNGDFAYITNALSSVVYILDKDKIAMATDIANVASLAKLHETYGNLWTEFQTELEEANATGFTDKLMTMININTMSNDTAANGGRPAKDDASLTDSGAKTRSNASNIEKGGKI